MKQLFAMVLAFCMLMSLSGCNITINIGTQPTEPPAATEPTATEPVTTEPTTTEPVATEPLVTEVVTAADITEAISKGLSVKLTNDIGDLNSITVNVGDDVVVDLGGKTVTAAERQPGIDHQYAFNVYGTLTLTNGVIEARGVEVRDGGKLIIGEGVTIKAADNNGGAAIYLYPGAEVVINGGTFTAEACKDELTGGSVVLNAGGKLTINGGTFTSNVNGPYVVNHHGGETIINDGVFNASRGVVAAQKGTVTINGGTFKKTNATNPGYVVYAGGSGVVNVKGGSFTTVGAENTLYCEDGNGFIKLEIATPEDVAAALSSGQSVTLSADVTVDEDLTISKGVVTLDLGGKTYSGNKASEGSNTNKIVVKSGATLIVKNGTLNVRSIQNEGGKVIIENNVTINAMDANGGGCIRNKNGGEVIIEGGTFNVVAYSDFYTNYGGAPCVYNENGTVTIKGGSFNSVTDAYAISNVSGTMTIEGGVFEAHRGVLYNSNGTLTVNGGTFAVTADSNGGWTTCHEGTGNLIINGGTFTHVISDRTYCDVTDNR